MECGGDNMFPDVDWCNTYAPSQKCLKPAETVILNATTTVCASGKPLCRCDYNSGYFMLDTTGVCKTLPACA
jgi:hypothetical protein